MKILGIIGLIVAVVGISSGLYCQIEYMPKVDQEELFGRALHMSYMDDKMMFGQIALFAGGLGFILGIISGIKKAKLGWVAAGIGLISTILGLMQATHMFS